MLHPELTSERHIYAIVSSTERDDSTDEPLCWSNEFGWVAADSGLATLFTHAERYRLTLPINGIWEDWSARCLSSSA
jgi:hypothetical protein